MTLPRSAADVLSGHVAFEVECIDRMYLNVYVPQLQYATGLVSYIHRQLGMPVASTAALAPVSAAFSKAMRAFAADRQIPWVDFARGQRKDDVAHDYLAGFTGTEGVLFIGRAQEKVPLFRTRKRRRADGSSYPWIAAETGVVNQFYCYCVDEDFGPFFLKFCSYFPFNAKLCINGNEWAKRQAARAGIGFTPLDNAFAAVDDVPALQAICHGLGPAQIDALLRKWLARLPHPFSPADRAAGYRYDISILQAEFSLTQMLDKPVSGRIFFEQVIRDNLDLGRPDRISLIFGRSHLPRPQEPHPRHLRHPRGHRRGHPQPARALQAHADQAVPQARTGPAHRDHHQPDHGLRPGQTADQPARPAADRLHRQPAATGRPTTQPRPHHRRRGPARRLRPHHPRRRHPHRRAALHRPPGPGAPAHPAGIPAAPRRVPQQGPARPARRIPRTPTHGPGSITPARPPTTCGGCASTASSNASRTPTATRSPPPACATPCSSPAPTTGSCAPASPNSARQPRPPYAKPRAYQAAIDDLTHRAGIAA